MVARHGTRVPLLIAGAGLMAAGVLLTALTASTSAGYLVLSYLVFGIGIGMVNAPITNSAVSGMPREQPGSRRGSPRPAARSARCSAWRSWGRC